ncbi:retrovirus-related Pol polyprotein from transposon TNT 1-94 [Trichonephila clavata]|uniref:Retrovirus-related Pol polyprotein from transposon TNT 1-94 n=1 Tax=Trichonephila clavata TaxID=2740835 RepID=A0A8X6L165_TRICU|nr:retrovirus-related Pol polyprotein from transposon TNT 1-94 [Trichonephila clavata]
MKQDLEKTETVYFSNFLSKKKVRKVPRNVNTVPVGTTATPADPSGKTEYQKKDGKVINCKTTKHLKLSSKIIAPCYLCNKYGHLKVNCKEKNSREKPPSTAIETYNTEFNINLRFCEAECSIIELNKHLVTIERDSCNLFEENSDRLDLNFPDYDDEEDDFDTVRDSFAGRLVSKTSTETPSTSFEKPDLSSDNRS